MPALTTIIEPDEFLGLCAIADLEKEASGSQADVTRIARTLMHGAVSARLTELGLPWAPSADDVQRRMAEPRPPAADQPATAGRERARKYGLSALLGVAALLLWGGYIRGWQWTGFQANQQLWDWLRLLLLPVVIGTLPLWIKHGRSISRARHALFGVAAVAFAGFVAVGYLVPLRWTGFSGNTLWSWYGLLLLPAAVTTLVAWPSAGRPLRRRHKTGLLVLVAAWAATVFGGYVLHWGWTGYQGNTLWDWLQLLLLPLVVPTVLLPAAGKWFTGHAAERAEAAGAPGAGRPDAGAPGAGAGRDAEAPARTAPPARAPALTR
ncbi:MAG TPA: hypothetical protein VMH35_28045 [Streptosporangiaceae bacterium]|nr:hypothetical protein [Streptosporangiaceae bacterium]